MAKTELIRVIEDGATVTLARRGGKVALIGDTFKPEDLHEVLVRNIRAGDPHALSLFELVEVDDDTPAATSSGSDLFDPKDNNQKDVLAYMRGASPAEAERVRKAELKSNGGKGRVNITEFKEHKKAAAGAGGTEPPAQLPEPVDGYGDLDVAQVLALLAANPSDEEFVGKIKSYEAQNAKRQEILDYDPASTQSTAGAGTETAT
jgi:hypothetical protein